MKKTTPLLLLFGCGGQIHHQYDHGRAYDETFTQQAQIERPSVQDAAFDLSGTEGLALRALVEEATTDDEDSTQVSDTD